LRPYQGIKFKVNEKLFKNTAEGQGGFEGTIFF